MDISVVDKNFAIPESVMRDGAVFYSIDDEPFRIYGVFREGEKYARLPASVREKVSEGVNLLGSNTAGGRVRFSTDSPYIIIRSVLPSVCKMSHMAFSGIMGVDMYVECDGEERYSYTLVPPHDLNGVCEFSGIREFPNRKMRTVTLNMPLYNDLSSIHIGLAHGSCLTAAPDYRYEKPIVYYGSSITQGGCASRPGLSYQAFLSRMLSADHINLGFSGNAKGEPVMAEYIAGLDMSVFVMDYDHNATTAEDLEMTHKPFFDIIRRKNPTLPIVMMSRSEHKDDMQTDLRREIIKRTYDTARASGDENVYFIDGSELFTEQIGLDGTVDGTHPNDLGFFSMAKRIYPVLKEILEKLYT